MAKRKKSRAPKRRKTPVQPKKRKAARKPSFSFLTKKGVARKDERGRFVSKEDWALRQREIQRRLRSKVEREQELARLRKQRQKEVERLRESRRKRTRTKTGRVRAGFQAKTDRQREKLEESLEADSALVAAGITPEPHEVQNVGTYRLLFWKWFGPEAVELAGDFIRQARDTYGDDTKGRVAIGTGYDKNSQWVGTRTLPLYDPDKRDDLWWALQSLLARVSGKAVVEEEEDVWVEVELILPGR